MVALPMLSRRFVALVALALLAALLSVARAASAQTTGWQTLPIPETSSSLDLFVPIGAGGTAAAPPAVIFLHGSGARPENYRNTVGQAASAVGAVVAMPRSQSNVGWGVAGDTQTLVETLQILDERGVDGTRVAIAGHSAGGAYAYLQAYLSQRGFSAVFTLGAPFYEVGALAVTGHVPPIRMYYGTEDPNYTDGDYEDLVAQWQTLGVTYEVDVREGFGHNSWPADAMAAGFTFLVGQHNDNGPSGAGPGGACVASSTRMCLIDRRFAVEVQWRDFTGGTGPGRVAPAGTDNSGLFWFFSPENWELLVKVLDGCEITGAYWVFAAATTNVEYELRVTDTYLETSVTYRNELGTASPAITDSSALQTCP